MPDLPGKDPAFEAKHPRARRGSREAGHFVNVIGRLVEMGGRWDEGEGRWKVPTEKLPELEALLDTIGANVTDAPPAPNPQASKLRRLNQDIGDPRLDEVAALLDQGSIEGHDLLETVVGDMEAGDHKKRLASMLKHLDKHYGEGGRLDTGAGVKGRRQEKVKTPPKASGLEGNALGQSDELKRARYEAMHGKPAPIKPSPAPAKARTPSPSSKAPTSSKGSYKRPVFAPGEDATLVDRSGVERSFTIDSIDPDGVVHGTDPRGNPVVTDTGSIRKAPAQPNVAPRARSLDDPQMAAIDSQIEAALKEFREEQKRSVARAPGFPLANKLTALEEALARKTALLRIGQQPLRMPADDPYRWGSAGKATTLPAGPRPADFEKIRDSYVVNDERTLRLNRELRSDSPSATAKSFASKTEKIIRSEKIARDSVVHRGVALTPEQIGAMVEGSVVTDKGLMSTDEGSGNPAFYVRERQFANPGTQAVLFDIRVPAGTNAADVGYGELVFARKTKLLIRQVEMDGVNVKVIAEVIV